MKRVWSEENKFNLWLRVELAVCEAWAQLGVIPQEALEKIRKASFNLERIKEIQKTVHHETVAFIRAVGESLGEESKFIHLGLTSSDVIDTALSLQLLQACELLEKDLAELITAVREKAWEHKDTIMMGRTHGVHAEPTTFGLKLALWLEELKRNSSRLEEGKKLVAVGKLSGAVGTHATVPLNVEEIACRQLGLGVVSVSSQIIQRDRHAQFLTTLAILASSLEKFATEIRSLQRTEMLEVEEPFEEGQTGSSAMPHKRNPELCERICGLARLVRGHALTSMENITLWHERDISHSSTERIIFPDSCLVLDYILSLFTYIMKKLQVYPKRMRQNLELTRGLIFSQRVLLALIEKGLTREKAYELVQRNAMKTWKDEADFFQLLCKDEEVPLSNDELRELFDYGYYLRYVNEIFRRIKS